MDIARSARPSANETSKKEESRFCRVKVGIGRPLDDEDVARYVLSPFTQGEREKVNAVLPKVVDALECVLCHGASVAMNRFHSPPPEQEVQ